MPVKPGLYEKVIDKHLQELITAAKEKQLRVLDEPMDKGESHLILAQYLSQIIAGALKEIKGQEKLADQINPCEFLLNKIANLGTKERFNHRNYFSKEYRGFEK